MRIEQSQLDLAAASSLVRQQVRIRQVISNPVAAKPAPAPSEIDDVGNLGSLGNDPQGKLLLSYLVAQQLLGRRIELFQANGQGVAAPAGGGAGAAQVRTLEVTAESEQVRLAAQGSVRTSDGRTIDFEAHLSLSRELVQVVNSVGAANSQDPLILNFDGRGVRLLAERVQFDLNADGEQESVPVVAAGSGILFVDRNGDGKATDGSELFGPRTGDGFGELAQEDFDQNGWIDEGDPVFGQLRVWLQSGVGPGSSYRLADLGIGAISTAQVETQFDLRAPGSALLGQIRSSGIYLTERGQAGTISHVDLTV